MSARVNLDRVARSMITALTTIETYMLRYSLNQSLACFEEPAPGILRLVIFQGLRKPAKNLQSLPNGCVGQKLVTSFNRSIRLHKFIIIEKV